MALKLKSRELPALTFRRALPEYLGPGGECFIQIKARAMGALNPGYVAAVEQVMRGFRVTQRKMSRIEEDEAYVSADIDAAVEMVQNRWGAIYDACVISWSSNIQSEDDAGKASNITCDRATFMALLDAKVPAIAKALTDFEAECKAAGDAILEEDKALAKN